MTANVKIYALIDPRDKRCRYVGKTKHSVYDRLRGHLSDAARRGGNIPRFKWINELTLLGLSPHAVTLETVHEDDWRTAEQMWVSEMRSRYPDLLNATDGGDGIHGHVHSEETKLKQSLAAFARYQRPGERERSGAAVSRGQARPEVREKLRENAKKKFSDPAFLKGLSQRAKEYSNRPEVKAALSARSKGKVLSETTKAKISAANKGKVRTEEYKKACAERRIGYKHSEETKEKMRASYAARVAKIHG